jgi:hypothetical protein
MAKIKYCTVCRKKIGWFRKLITNRWDKDPLHLISLSQFCCNSCAAEGLSKIMKEIEIKND